MFVDTHCHLFLEDYPDRDKLINKLKPNIIIVSGVDLKTNKEVLELCRKYANVYGTLGIDPTVVNKSSKEDLKFIEKNINNPKIVGLGEMGLDYYRGDNYDQQKRIFKQQLEIANKYNKPVVIHSRKAFSETYNILKQYPNLNITMHCFSYDLEKALKCIKLGFKLGINGIITFKNSIILKEVVKNIDLKHILLETDCPFLAPVPYRGKRNEPSYIPLIAKEIANLKDMDISEVLTTTTLNAFCQFDIKNNL